MHDATQVSSGDVRAGHVTVHVTPKHQTRYAYEKRSIVVECTASVGHRVEDLPFINFYVSLHCLLLKSILSFFVSLLSFTRVYIDLYTT